jgi:predicted enzyme related to lactoylglutathione lyase
LTALPEKSPGRPGWLGYIRVADVAATAKAVEGRGGHILLAPQDVPGALQVAIVTDPLGGAVGLVGKSTSPEAAK